MAIRTSSRESAVCQSLPALKSFAGQAVDFLQKQLCEVIPDNAADGFLLVLAAIDPQGYGGIDENLRGIYAVTLRERLKQFISLDESDSRSARPSSVTITLSEVSFTISWFFISDEFAENIASFDPDGRVSDWKKAWTEFWASSNFWECDRRSRLAFATTLAHRYAQAFVNRVWNDRQMSLSLWMVSPDDPALLRCQYSSDHLRSSRGGESIDLAEPKIIARAGSVQGQAFDEACPVVAGRTLDRERVDKHKKQPGTAVAIPVFMGSNVLGVIVLESKDKDFFTVDDDVIKKLRLIASCYEVAFVAGTFGDGQVREHEDRRSHGVEIYGLKPVARGDERAQSKAQVSLHEPAGAVVVGLGDVIEELLSGCSTEYAARYSRLHELSHEFRSEVARQLQPTLNSELQKMPQDSYAEKQALASWVNGQLRELGLAVKCPKTGRPANLVADIKEAGSDVSRFRFEIRDENGKKARTLASRELPELELMEDEPRQEPLLKWTERLRQARGKRKRE